MQTLEPTVEAVVLASEFIATTLAATEVVCECAWCETGLSVYCIGPLTCEASFAA